MLQCSIFTAFLCAPCQNFQHHDALPPKLIGIQASLRSMQTASPATLAPASRKGGIQYLWSAAACGLTTVLTWPVHNALDPVNTVMLFLLTVVLVAARWGRGPAVMAAFLSVGLFDFFFVPPRLSFAVTDIQYVLTFVVMLAVALIIGHLTIGLRQRADEAVVVANRSRALYNLASHLAGALSVEQVREHSAGFAYDQLAADLHLLVPDSNDALQGVTPADSTLLAHAQPEVARILKMVYQDNKGITSHQVSADGSLMVVLPLPGSTRSRGVVVLTHRLPHDRTLENHRPLLEAVASLIGTALERLHFVEVAHHSQLEASAERLRNSILSALSHDVRTPLTSLYGLADTLTLMQPPLPDKAREMSAAIRDQAMRLNRMVSNLLDMARLQSGRASGHLPLRREWQPIEEVIGPSIQMLGSSLDRHPVRVQLSPGLPMVYIDAVLLERVFANLIENASKYSPPDTAIRILADFHQAQLRVRIYNDGSGFPPDKLNHVFDLFERGLPESNIPGVGLGLAICQAIIEAHGGHIQAINPPEGGALVEFDLPLGTPPTIEPEAAREGGA